MRTLKMEFCVVVDDEAVESIEQLRNRVEGLLNADTYPEIKRIHSITITDLDDPTVVSGSNTPKFQIGALYEKFDIYDSSTVRVQCMDRTEHTVTLSGFSTKLVLDLHTDSSGEEYVSICGKTGTNYLLYAGDRV